MSLVGTIAEYAACQWKRTIVQLEKMATYIRPTSPGIGDGLTWCGGAHYSRSGEVCQTTPITLSMNAK